MKKILFVVAIILVSATPFAQKKIINKRQQKVKSALSKYRDNIDNRMKGPNGEVIYIGPNGGRYYMKNSNKIYVQYKGNK